MGLEARPSAADLDTCYTQWNADKVEVLDHRSDQLRKKKSLEELRGSFGEGKIVYDPTGAFKRIDGLVELARSLRNALPKEISKLGYESSRQTLYVILDASLKKRSVAQMRALVLIITGVAESWRRTTAPDCVPAIRVGFELPLGTALVPVDKASLPLGSWARLKKVGVSARKLFGMVTFVGFGSLAGAAAAVPIVPTATLDIASVAHDSALDTQDFWSDPTFGLLGVPEMQNSQNVQPARRVAQSLEWSVNEAAQGGSDLAPFDVRFYSRSDLVALQGGGFLTQNESAPSEGGWVPAFNAVVDLSQARDEVLLVSLIDILMWLQLLFGVDTIQSPTTLPGADVTQGYIV